MTRPREQVEFKLGLGSAPKHRTVTFGAEVEAGERGSKASEKQGGRVAISCPISWISSDHDNDERRRRRRRRKGDEATKNKAAKTSRRRDRGGDDEAKTRHSFDAGGQAKAGTQTQTHSLTQRQTTDKTET